MSSARDTGPMKPNLGMCVPTRCCHGSTKYITEGGVLCWPGEKLSVIGTDHRTIDIRCDRVQSTTRQGDLITFITETVVTAIIPKDNKSCLEIACELFLNKTDSEINKIISEVAEGCHRALAGKMPANEIVHNRTDFNRELRELLSIELIVFGVIVEKVMLTHIKFPSDEILNAVCNDVKIGQVDPEDTKVTFY